MAKVKVICDTCGKEFEKYESKLSKHNFCNRECYLEFHRVKRDPVICETCGKSFITKNPKHKHHYCCKKCYQTAHSSGDKNRICPNCGKHFIADRKERIYCSHKCYTSHREYAKGSEHHNGKGGISKINDKKDSGDYKQWRQQVYERDNGTCQHCGYKGKEINAHHIYSGKYYPEKRYDINNGITLCTTCHIKLHQIKGYNTDQPIMF